MNQALLPPQLRQPASSREGGISAFLQDKAATIHKLILQIHTQIDIRVKQSARLSQEIRADIGRVSTELMNFPDLRPGDPPDPRRLALEKQRGDLHKEGRIELTACWRETAQLHEELRRYIKEYDTIMQRVRLLSPTSTSQIHKQSMAPQWPATSVHDGPSLADIQAAIRASTFPSR